MQQTQDDLIALQGERYAELANSKNNIIKELQDEIEKHNKLLERFNPQTLDERLHNSDIYKHFYDIAMKPTTRPSEADWMALREMMNREIPRFFSILNSGTKPLKTHEYNLCILIRLGFKSKDYYSIMDIKPNYSAGIRKSLLKRIFGEEGTAEDFNRKILEIG
jgi:hypothetical protein